MTHTKGSDELFLIKAVRIGTIQDESDSESTVRRILSPDACIIADIANGEYVITSIGNSRMDTDRLDTLVREKAQAGMDIYELTWSYKGQEYTSVAIASDKDGVRYDNIGYRALSFAERPLIINADVLLRDGIDSLAFDPDTIAIDTAGVDYSRGVFLKYRECKDGFGHKHGDVFLSYQAVFVNRYISSIKTTVTITHTENDNWVIYGGFNTIQGGEGSLTVSFSWYYAFGSYVPQISPTPDGIFLLPQGAFGETSCSTINRPGIFID
jgi:hypothetical protein